MSKIELQGVSMCFVDGGQSFLALDNINLKVEDGEFVCVIGSSGCGKSTLISLLAGLVNPTSGTILIDGEPLTGPGTNRGTVFQHYSLFPWLSAQKNVTFGVKQAGICKTKKEISARSEDYLQKVGLGDYLDKFPFQLSGGMQQRVAIARTLAMDTEILLMDEPFGAIDPKNRLVLQEMTVELCKGGGSPKTAVFVTHDMDEAILLADRIIFMEPKRIKEEITLKLPRDLERAELARSEEYTRVRSRLMGLFYEEMKNSIGGEEVVI